MKVKKIMQADVVTSTADAPVATAAQVMWENDCGFVPVLEEGADAPPDCLRSGPGQLLVGDRAGNRLEGRVLLRDAGRPHLPEQAGEALVPPGQSPRL